MQEDPLTYRSSGVDVETYNRAGAQIKAHIQETFGAQVRSGTGQFGTAIGLEGWGAIASRLRLYGTLAGGDSPTDEKLAEQIISCCRENLPSTARPLAFMDYIGAGGMDYTRVVDLVGAFSRILRKDPKIPLVGGETAEMPGVFHPKRWEVVGAMFALQEASIPGRDQGSPAIGVDGKPAAVELPVPAGRSLDQQALVFSIDGVGTKTKLGVATRQTSGLALDIIHHSLNDILCQGARGLAIMLYIGCYNTDPQLVGPLQAAASECCKRNGLVLLDCQVSEKPDIYLPGEIDICGAIVGTVQTERLIQGKRIQAGDLLIGLPSSGLHTNGYSLARKALLERCGLGLDQYLDELGCNLGEALLEPHRNYAPPVLSLIEDEETTAGVKGIAHITGGGFKDNLERVLPEGLCAEIRLDSWQPPPIFELIRRCGNIPLQDPVGKGMYESFNMGIGLVLVVAPEYRGSILKTLQDGGVEAVEIGRVYPCVQAQDQEPAQQIEKVRLL
jgi:phosphoribosylformylglycinamidine cyclo-ligase